MQCALWIALCFTLTSAVYFSWVYHLITFTDGTETEWISMVAGYLAQAAGLGLAAWRLRRKPAGEHGKAACLALLLFMVFSVPALLGDSLAASAVFGLLMNLACGVLAGLYIFSVVVDAEASHQSLVFGGGYALATVAVGLLSLPGRGGSWLQGRNCWILYIPLAAVIAWMTLRLKLPGTAGEKEESLKLKLPEDAGEKARSLQLPGAAGGKQGRPQGELPGMKAGLAPEALWWPEQKRENSILRDPLILACVTAVLISLVKNLGFGFPSADIAAGLRPEISRIPYAAGLLAAGFILDRNRKNGVVCTTAALAIPFILLGITSEPVPAAIFWGLDYLFFGFFSVFRVMLFVDIAGKSRRWYLAPLGLLLGRVGDAVGTGICLRLTDQKLALIIVTAVLFSVSVMLLFRLYQRFYEPGQERQRSEQEVFEDFCLHYDFSSREREVFRMIIAGQTNGEIAAALFIMESTVKYHVRNILQKTGCANRGELQKKYALALYPQLQVEEVI